MPYLPGWAKDHKFAGIQAKESYVDENPFYRTKVKLKKEIVTMGVEGYRPDSYSGHLRGCQGLECSTSRS